MPIQISRVDPSDFPSMVAIYRRAFASSLVSHGYANTPSLQLTAWLESFFREEFEQPSYRLFKAVDSTTGELVGWTAWVYPHVASSAPATPEGEDYWPEGADVALLEALFGAPAAMQKKWVVTEDMYVVETVVVHPAHQRRGVGAALLRHGLKLVDAEGRKVYVEAAKEGKPIYKRLG